MTAVVHLHPQGCGQLTPHATNVAAMVTCALCRQYLEGGFLAPGLSHAERSALLRPVFGCARGFVTDMGAPVPVTRDGTVIDTLPRYGVWKHTGRKHEVVLTTDSLEAAIAEAQR